MTRIRIFTTLAVLLALVAAIALWPTYIERSTQAARASALPTMAPVARDYLLRPRLVAAWERNVATGLPNDFISPRQLADQYLQRYRERGDIGDVVRSIDMAKRSLRARRYGNPGALVDLASAQLTLHKFYDALATTKQIEAELPRNPSMRLREASLDLEIGRYDRARAILGKVPTTNGFDVSRETVASRYDELTGHLARARLEIERPLAYENSQIDAPAQARAWFFFRSGELAFEAGDNDGAVAFEKQAIDIFPYFADAYRAKARVECALKRWNDCLASAQTSANMVPYPETLGFVEDAQRALGDRVAADATAATILTIEKIGDAQHISDRLLAIYESEHRIRSGDAYAIAKRELASRDDIITEDTLAWAAAADGRWNEARAASRKAMRFDTEISLMQYHAGVIAAHFGERERAKRYLLRALTLNPSFHQTYADDARARVAAL
ncbi:MAG: hypothetical protein NVS3B17_23190 [Vulcanimicrobiaceae bacterium]